MLKAFLPVGALLLIAAAPPAAWRLSSDGYGPITIGMSQDQVVRTLGSPLDDDRPPPAAGTPEMDDWRRCHEAKAREAPGLWFMFEDGRLTSVTIGDDSQVRTTAGLGLGDTEARVKRIYGRALTIENHEYEGPPAHYLTVAGARRGRGVKFTTDKTGKVVSISGGGRSISYTEGCA